MLLSTYLSYASVALRFPAQMVGVPDSGPGEF